MNINDSGKGFADFSNSNISVNETAGDLTISGRLKWLKLLKAIFSSKIIIIVLVIAALIIFYSVVAYKKIIKPNSPPVVTPHGAGDPANPTIWQ
jgi:hypothetical protein